MAERDFKSAVASEEALKSASSAEAGLQTLVGSHTHATQNLSDSVRLCKGLKTLVNAEDVARSHNPVYQRRLQVYMQCLGEDNRLPYAVFNDLENSILLGDVFLEDDIAPLLREVFEHYCNIGDRTNTEWLSTQKWVRMLTDARILLAATDAPPNPYETAANAEGEEISPDHMRHLTRAEGELIHRKVLNACDPGMGRLSFDLFCKALAVLSIKLYPVPNNLAQGGEEADFFSPEEALQIVFRKIIEFCHPKDRSIGVPDDNIVLGQKEIAIVNRHKEYLLDLFYSFTGKHQSNPSIYGKCGTGQQKRRERTYVCNMSEAAEDPVNLLDHLNKVSKDPDQRYSLSTYAVSDGTLDGETLVKSRRKRMSYQQFLDLNLSLGTVPSLIQRHTCLTIFKRSNGSRSELGYLDASSFLESIAYLAIEAFSKSPYKFEYPSYAEKISGFILRVKQENKRKKEVVAAFGPGAGSAVNKTDNLDPYLREEFVPVETNTPGATVEKIRLDHARKGVWLH